MKTREEYIALITSHAEGCLLYTSGWRWVGDFFTKMDEGGEKGEEEERRYSCLLYTSFSFVFSKEKCKFAEKIR